MSRRPLCHQCHCGDCLQHDIECAITENTQNIEAQSASSVQRDVEMGGSSRAGQLNSDSQDMRKAQ